MFASVRVSVCLLPAICLSVFVGGCAGHSQPKWVRNIMAEDDVDPRGALAPYKVVEQLRKDRKTLGSAAPDRQQAKAVELAAAYQNEADPLVRSEIIRTIAVCGAPQSGATLTAALQDSERDVRLALADAWAVHGGPRAIPSLNEMMRQDRSHDVRMAAARALGRLKGPDVVKALAPALEDPDPALQFRAVQSLRESTGKDFGDDVGVWREFVHGGSPPEISTAQRLKRKYF